VLMSWLLNRSPWYRQFKQSQKDELRKWLAERRLKKSN
jgi:hypothetical protein